MRGILLIILLSFAFVVLPQDTNLEENISELKDQLELEQDLSKRSDLFNAIAWEYRDNRADSSLYFSNQAYQIAIENRLQHQEIQSLNYMGVAYRNLGVFSRAFEKYIEALRLSEEYGDDEQRGYSLINLGNLYLFQTNYQGAINYFIKGLDQAQELGNRRMQAYCYLNLGRSNQGIQAYGQAELYYEQAIALRKELNDEYGLIAVELDLAEVYRRKGELDRSLKYFQAIVDRLDEENHARSLTLAYNNISRIYLAKGELRKSQQMAVNARRLAKRVNSRFDEKETLKNLSDIYAGMGDFNEAFEYYTDYAELNQQLFSEENIRKIEQLKNQYEIEQQEKENEFLRTQDDLNKEIISRQQIIIGLSISASLLFVIVAFVSYRAFLVRKRLSLEISDQKDQIESDKNLIESQSNKLKELDKAKSRFFANVSHDLRSPLSLILGSLEMMAEDDDTFLSPASKKNLDVSFKNSKRLIYLTDEINDITRLEEGKINLRLEYVKINSYLKMLTEMFYGTAEYKGVKLSFHTTLKDQEHLLIDPRQFEKIFYNLVSNAIRYTSKGDQISISTSSLNDQILVYVKDTGEGINPESLPYIFDRFYQSKDNEYKTKEGLGIGLALVKDLVELHGGHIQANSTKGAGTEIIITLKRADKPANASSQKEDLSEFIKDRQQVFRDLDAESKTRLNVDLSSPESEERPVVLIVDDHPEIRYYIRQILEEQYLVMEATHGIEALQILEAEQVDLIITDLMMPWMDGFELIESINSNEEMRKIPLLVVSARISEEDREKVLYKGINEFIKKPFSKKELILRIDNLLNQKDRYQNESPDTFKSIINENFVDVESDILMKLETIVKDKISDANLSIYDLTEAMAASERQVYRLVKKLTGLTPLEYITEVRMQYADYLIRKNMVKNATEASRNVGINNVTTFSRLYKKKFGIKPVELLSDE
ncbi:MAG: response regulator [Cyclobacteriaceae bacterium]